MWKLPGTLRRKLNEVEVDVDVNDEISEQSIARPSRWLRDKSKRYDLV